MVSGHAVPQRFEPSHLPNHGGLERCFRFVNTGLTRAGDVPDEKQAFSAYDAHERYLFVSCFITAQIAELAVTASAPVGVYAP
jgi:hypothetical protein